MPSRRAPKLSILEDKMLYALQLARIHIVSYAEAGNKYAREDLRKIDAAIRSAGAKPELWHRE